MGMFGLQESKKISPFFWLHKRHLRRYIARELEVGYFRPSPALLRKTQSYINPLEYFK